MGRVCGRNGDRLLLQPLHLPVHAEGRLGKTWPLHDLAITNMLLCMACTWGVGGASYIAQ